jgi:hypothetical protein
MPKMTPPELSAFLRDRGSGSFVMGPLLRLECRLQYMHYRVLFPLGTKPHDEISGCQLLWIRDGQPAPTDGLLTLMNRISVEIGWANVCLMNDAICVRQCIDDLEQISTSSLSRHLDRWEVTLALASALSTQQQTADLVQASIGVVQ